MAQIRMHVEIDRANDPARDIITNVLYFDTDAGAIGGADLEDLADDLRQVYADGGTAGKQWATGYRVRVKAYTNPGAGPTGPPDFVTDYANLPSGGVSGPRDVCVCLSYFSGSNTPRKRGRSYIGPLTREVMSERVPVTVRDMLSEMAEGFSGLGGVNVQWVQYSPTSGTFSNVSDYFIDDEWDTQRRRGLRAATRTVGTVDG